MKKSVNLQEFGESNFGDLFFGECLFRGFVFRGMCFREFVFAGNLFSGNLVSGNLFSGNLFSFFFLLGGFVVRGILGTLFGEFSLHPQAWAAAGTMRAGKAASSEERKRYSLQAAKLANWPFLRTIEPSSATLWEKEDGAIVPDMK